MENSSQPAGYVALCHEFCVTVDSAREALPADFCRDMLRYLPRIYISAFDLDADGDMAGELYAALDEEAYLVVSSAVAGLMGEHDTYLDTFADDMKYSDTPVAASVSEDIADLYQVFFDFVATVRDIPSELLPEVLGAMKAAFTEYWGAVLCRAMKAIHAVYTSNVLNSEQ